MSNEVSLKVKIESNTQGLDEIKPKLDEVKEAVEEVTESSAKIGDSFLSLNTALVALDSLSNLFSKVSDSVSKLTSVYALQETAEVKLAQVMRNTMDATDADIQSIKELCSAQQELGVIGDEVQLAGAQELGTYLEKADTLKKLIPVMNDMVAQQYGLEASQESAVGIATMLGKVMEGQTSALSRYGYSFDEAQEQILKFGTEEERAATLAEVVSDSVGGVNEALAQTDSGKMKQTENTIGDLKETMGAALTSVQPFIAQLAEVGAMVTNIVGLGKAFVSIINPIKSAISGVKALGLALKSIGTIGIVGILTTITAAAIALYSAFSDDAGAAERLEQQTEAYNNAATEATAKINQEIAALKPLVDNQENDIKTVQRLNETYGSVFGTFQTTAEWYDTLTTKVKDYALAQGLSAKNAEIARQLGKAQVRQMEVEAKMQELRDKGEGQTADERLGGLSFLNVNGIETEYGILLQEQEQLKKTIKDLTAESMKWTTEENKVRESLKGTEQQTAATSMSYDDITQALSENEKAQKALRPEQESELARLKEQRAELLKLKAEREKALGISDNKQSTKVEVAASEGSLKYINDQISKLNAQLQLAVDPASRASIQEQIDRWQFDKKRIEIEVEGSKITSRSSNADVIGAISGGKTTDVTGNVKQIHEYNEALEDAQKGQKTVQEQMGGLADSFSTLGDTIGGAAGAWLEYGASLLSTIGQAIPAITNLIGINMAEAESERVKTNANVQGAVSGAMAAHSGIPFVGVALGLAAVAAIIAAMMSIPKFAAGGIAYGPTLGLFGEYPGASNNPEVVAPLSRLKGMLNDNKIGGSVEFKLRGRELVGILSNESKITNRR